MACVIAAGLCPQRSEAEAACSEPSSDCAVVGKLEISASFGVGQRSNPVVGRSDIPLIVIPHISYYGKRFFLENLELGFTLHDGEVNTFNLIATPGYDRVFFYRNDLQNLFVAGGTVSSTLAPVADPQARTFPVGPRHTTYLAGPEWTFGYGEVTGQVNALREVTGEHDGYEVRAAMAAPLAIPLLGAKSSLVASAGLTWKSSEVVRYYYGVDGLYQPGSATIPFVKLRYAYPLADRWTVNAFVHYEQLPDSIANSPIIAKDHVTTFFAGVVFKVR
jgi:outer membrane protein